MQFIPWRVKNFLSEHFPLLYHLAANAGTGGNSREHWDARLERSWDDPAWNWPTKNNLIASLTQPTDVIVDIACGNGGILRHLRGQGYRQLHGVEISQYAIRRLRGDGIEMHHSVLPAIALPDRSFDVVIASQVLEHIVRRGRFLEEVRRILKPGGRALVFVPDDCLGPISEPEHVTKFTARSLRRLLTRHFAEVRIESMRDANHPMPVLFARVATPRD